VSYTNTKKVLIAIIVIGLLLSGFTLIADAYFVGSSESDVFHKPSCFYVDRIKPDHLVYFDTVREACNAGYRPCKRCNPPPCPPTLPPPSPPEVTTKDATGGTYATLNGYLASTGNCVCNVWFEYGATMSYGRSTTKMSKTTTGEFSEPISGLTPGTTYHYRAVASNAEGTVYGLASSFCVLGPPQVTTIAASSVSTTSTTLSGNLDSTRCLDCLVWFEYGTTTNYSNSTPEVYKSSPGTFSKHISGLSPGTTYHFRAIALNREGIDYGADRLFETPTQKLPLRIGAFNIQVFGKSKAGKPEVMDVLADIIRTYDIVAIQEIRDKDQTALPQLVDLVNSKGVHYDYVVGPRLGRSSSKEQYAYIYNNQTVNLNGTPWTYPEPNGTDPFLREPYIAAFRAVNGSFDATFLVMHVDPDKATEEINALDAVVNYTKNEYPDEPDFIVLGNLNADCSYFDKDSNCSICGDDYYWCINNSIDTTTSATNCTYDRIIITSPAVPDYTGDSGVFRYDILYNLTEEETKAVSDHYPIYAEFYCDGNIDTPEKRGYPPLNFSRHDPKLYLIAPILHP